MRHPRRHLRSSVTLAALLAAAARRAAADPVWEPSAAVSFDVAGDSNIYNGRGPDMVTRITPHLALTGRDEATQLTLSYDLSYWDYARGTARASLNQRAGFAFQRRLSRRLHIQLGDAFIRAEDPGFLTRVGVIAPQTAILDNLAEAALDIRLTRRLILAGSYAYHHTSFDQPPPPAAPLFDGDEQDGALAFTYRLTRLDDLRVAGRMQYFTAAGNGLAFTESPTFGWRHQLARPLELFLEGGPLLYQGLDAARAIPQGFAGDAVTWRAAGTLRFYSYPWRAAFSAVRDLVGGTGAGSVLWAEYVTAQVGYHFARATEARAAVAYFANGYAPSQPRQFDGVSVDAALDWRAESWLSIGGYFAFRWQQSLGGPFPDVTRYIGGVRVQFLVGAEAAPPPKEVHE